MITSRTGANPVNNSATGARRRSRATTIDVILTCWAGADAVNNGAAKARRRDANACIVRFSERACTSAVNNVAAYARHRDARRGYSDPAGGPLYRRQNRDQCAEHDECYRSARQTSAQGLRCE